MRMQKADFKKTIALLREEIASLKKELKGANAQLKVAQKVPSIYDELTGLFSQNYLETEIERAIEQQKRSKDDSGYVSLIFIDMDGLKYINDTYGHHVGNEAIKTLANTITSITRESDIVSRIHGDEFIIASITKDKKENRGLFDRIKSIIERIPFTIKGKRKFISASAGFYCKLLAETRWNDIFTKADAAMYRHKKIKRKGRR